METDSSSSTRRRRVDCIYVSHGWRCKCSSDSDWECRRGGPYPHIFYWMDGKSYERVFRIAEVNCGCPDSCELIPEAEAWVHKGRKLTAHVVRTLDPKKGRCRWVGEGPVPEGDGPERDDDDEDDEEDKGWIFFWIGTSGQTMLEREADDAVFRLQQRGYHAVRLRGTRDRLRYALQPGGDKGRTPSDCERCSQFRLTGGGGGGRRNASCDTASSGIMMPGNSSLPFCVASSFREQAPERPTT